MSAFVTCLMPAYNAAATITDAIRSVEAQTLGDWRLIVIDDGSTDETAPCVAALAADEPRITLLRQPENGGVSSARNAGAAKAETDFLCFLDADDTFTPDYMERMAGRLLDEPDLAMVCCDAFLFTDRPGEGSLGRCSQKEAMIPPITLERVIARQFQIYTATMMRREWFIRLGGYDETFRTAEDFDLWVRLLIAGGRVAFIDEPLAWYRTGQKTSLTNDAGANAMRDNIRRALDRALAADPSLKPVHEIKARELDYANALHNAKAALLDRHYTEFFRHSGRALDCGRNPKLRLIRLVARLSPALARQLVLRTQ